MQCLPRQRAPTPDSEGNGQDWLRGGPDAGFESEAGMCARQADCRPDNCRTLCIHNPPANTMRASPPHTSDASRGARLEARISATQKSVLQRAATLSGRTLSEFVVASAQEAAARVIREHESIQLSRAEQTAFVKALLTPAEPGAALRGAAKAYKRRAQ